MGRTGRERRGRTPGTVPASAKRANRTPGRAARCAGGPARPGAGSAGPIPAVAAGSGFCLHSDPMSPLAPTARRLRSGAFPLGLLAASVPLSGVSAAQPPAAEPRVLEFTIADLDEDQLDFLIGWDRDTGDLLEAFARGTTRFHRAFGFAPERPGLTASAWLWLPASTAPPARPAREAAPVPGRSGPRRAIPVRPGAGRWRGVPPRSPRPNRPRAGFPEPRRKPGAGPPPAFPTDAASAGRRPPPPRAASPGGARPRGAPGGRAAPAPRPGSAAPPRAPSAGSRGRAVPRPGRARRSR